MIQVVDTTKETFFTHNGQRYRYDGRNDSDLVYPVFGVSTKTGNRYRFEEAVLYSLRYADGTLAPVKTLPASAVTTTVVAKKSKPKRLVLVATTDVGQIVLPLYFTSRDDLVDEIRKVMREALEAGKPDDAVEVKGASLELTARDILGDVAGDCAGNPALINSALEHADDWNLRILSILDWYKEDSLNDDELNAR